MTPKIFNYQDYWNQKERLKQFKDADYRGLLKSKHDLLAYKEMKASVELFEKENPIKMSLIDKIGSFLILFFIVYLIIKIAFI